MLDKILLNDLQKEKIEEHTFSCYPEEMCGFLTKDDFIPLENIAEEPLASFKVSEKDYIKYFNDIVAIVHSHTRHLNKTELFDLRTPSYADYISQKATGKPWLIVGCEGLTVTEPIQFPRVPDSEYIGRRFQWFIYDCYNLVQDFYLFELGITLKEQRIGKNYQEFRNLNDIFIGVYEEYDFKEIELLDIKEGDLLLLDNGGFRCNHLGIYTKGQILHQGLVSVLVPFETYLGRINKVLRYDPKD